MINRVVFVPNDHTLSIKDQLHFVACLIQKARSYNQSTHIF